MSKSEKKPGLLVIADSVKWKQNLDDFPRFTYMNKHIAGRSLKEEKHKV